MEIHPGSSGSPVFDANGRLVGIVKGRYRGTNSIGFVIPLETITSFMNGS
jgi:serine protease Do